jgi:leader peptidase (prepilin peptidase)/N-methyltransferase
MIRLLTLAFAALGGLIAGSFFNVCIHRLPRRESVVSPGSRCPNCGAAIGWRDNIPILSWIALRGRCRQCSARISAQYPLIELVTAVVAVAVVAVTPVGPLLASRLVLAGILIVLFMIDLEHQILPNVITLPGIVVGFLFSLVAPPGPISSLAGIVLGGGVLYLIGTAYYVVRKEEGIGMGDVKMLAMIGAFLGWQAVVLTVVLSSFAGAVIGLALIVFTRADMRHALPFGTFLALGAMVAMVAGDAIVSWYTGLYPTL